MAANKKKVVKFPNRMQRILRDSGILLFTIIAGYMLVCLVTYLKKPHVSVYEVKYGSISKDYSYTGLVIRKEQIIPADRTGYLTYYAREGEKVGAKTTICAIDETGKLTEMMGQSNADQNLLTTEDMLTFKEKIQSYQNLYDNNDFSEVYNFKQDLESSILETVHLKLLTTATQSEENSPLVNVYKSAADGVLSYHVDGMENLTMESITKDMLDASGYKSTDLKKQSQVDAQNPMYKLITEDDWAIVITLDSDLAKTLVDEEYIEIAFLKDNRTAWGKVDSWEVDGTTFVQFSFTNSMIRYATDRYLDIRFQLNDVEGLKIPISSVKKESFYTIPKEYVTKGGDQNVEGVYQEIYEKDGSVSQKFTALEIVWRTDSLVYVSTNDFDSGNTLIKPESTERYSIGRVETLLGVYNINKGYAVFSPIEILCENTEYYIISADTSGGLSQYDRIILEAETVENNDTFY